MARYVIRAPKTKANDDDWYEPPLEPALTVIESNPVPTGLFDEHGNEIWRTNDPIGFLHHE